MQRRDFIKISTGALLFGNGLILLPEDLYSKKRKKTTRKKKTPEIIKTNETVFNDLLKKANQLNWKDLNIGDLIINIGKNFVGFPYESGTLEINGEKEEIVVNLLEFDCVTFMESSLAFARIVKKGLTTLQDFANELTFIRYRKGKISDYTSRLHYTSDWITDNVSKGVVIDITRSIGGEPIQFNVYYMTENSEQYPVLRKVPKMIAEIEVYEDHIRKRTYYYIPNEKVSLFKNNFKNGDIVAITTNKPGLDYAHVGLIIVENGEVKLLHASSKQKKVAIENDLETYLKSIPTNTGISVLRANEP